MSDRNGPKEDRPKILVTGSSGHLGEALMRMLQASPYEPVGLDVINGEFTSLVGSIVDRSFVKEALQGCDGTLHTATLHKPHVATHAAEDFVSTNIQGTLNVLEESVAQGGKRVVFTSTTSTFGMALVPPPGQPAAWITEDLRPIPKNIYGVTKVAAEDLCELFHRRHKLPCLILKTSRFFPEEDDNALRREGYEDLNAKVNELLHRRLDIEDAGRAHWLAFDRAHEIGFGRYILSATTPFTREDLSSLRTNPGEVLSRVCDYRRVYDRRGWRLFDDFERLYINEKARRELGWEPRVDFQYALSQLEKDQWPFSQLMREVGKKGYHPGRSFDEGPFPVQ